MRISAVARAAGVSTRTVRFYHQLAVLPEPPRRTNGYRDYSFEDLARLLRLRWLADSGLPLAVAGTGAAHHGHDLLDDVDDALTHLGERLVELGRQQRLLSDLRDNLVAGHRLSPLPAQLNQLFETLLDDAAPAAHEILLTERETLETLALTSGGDPELFDRYAEVLSAPDVRTEVLPLLARFAALRGVDPDEHAEEVASLAAAIAARSAVARLLQYAVADLPPEAFTGAGGPVSPQGPDTPGPSAEEVVPDPAQRALLAEIIRRVRS